MEPDRVITQENCKEAFGLDTELTPQRAAEIAEVLVDVLGTADLQALPLELLRRKDYSLAEFFINQPFDESALSGELKRYIREDSRVDALERAIGNTANRNKSRLADTQALRQRKWLTEQLVIFELIRDCAQEQSPDHFTQTEDDYENAG